MPLQALQSATVVAAELLRMGSKVGTLELGRLADVIAVDGDPLTDISTLERVRFFMRGGKTVLKQP